LRARVRVRPLATHRQPTTMPNAAIRTDVHQPLDVHGHFRPQRTLDLEVALDHATDLVHVRVRQITDTKRGINPRLFYDLESRVATDAVDVRESDLDLFLAREIDASNTSHS